MHWIHCSLAHSVRWLDAEKPTAALAGCRESLLATAGHGVLHRRWFHCARMPLAAEAARWNAAARALARAQGWASTCRVTGAQSDGWSELNWIWPMHPNTQARDKSDQASGVIVQCTDDKPADLPCPTLNVSKACKLRSVSDFQEQRDGKYRQSIRSDKQHVSERNEQTLRKSQDSKCSRQRHRATVLAGYVWGICYSWRLLLLIRSCLVT